MSTTELRGRALAEATLEAIRREPHRFDPTAWRYDATMCFGAWAADLAGGRWLATPDDHGVLCLPDGRRAMSFESSLLLAEPAIDPPVWITHWEGHPVVHVQRRAALLLHLNPAVCHMQGGTLLFGDRNTPDTLAGLIEAAYDGGSDA
ncbi:hypothetical protein [Bailinhaonella thermotolerans]|uniref:Uncharacterized protein n=1 Tax=Bailinhaonella thermotolerans TaxID=1070861 RepID=A0A3A4A5V6_9ACTN|nr:hypothetical protein [Bailinhaonella thermotolerans]RJL21043.1 hypothetical protein D5H75_38160 [Bailinhaonella thermotolerans]